MSKVQGFSEVQMQQMAQMVAMTISQVMPQKKQPMAQKLTSGNLIGCSVVESYCFVQPSNYHNVYMQFYQCNCI